jgi:hypothetical protein
MINNIPTAEEFLFDNFEGGAINPDILIQFAKLHVEAALENVLINIEISADGFLNEESILNAYPLKNIK